MKDAMGLSLIALLALVFTVLGLAKCAYGDSLPPCRAVYITPLTPKANAKLIYGCDLGATKTVLAVSITQATRQKLVQMLNSTGAVAWPLAPPPQTQVTVCDLNRLWFRTDPVKMRNC